MARHVGPQNGTAYCAAGDAEHHPGVCRVHGHHLRLHVHPIHNVPAGVWRKLSGEERHGLSQLDSTRDRVHVWQTSGRKIGRLKHRA